MVARIQTNPAFRVSAPQPLFELTSQFWDVAPDGKRFLVVKGPEAATGETKLQVVDNWFDELRRKATARKKVKS